ncbi:MAG: EF-hand domain-containing protein [Burkholderiaceae bacterium]
MKRRLFSVTAATFAILAATASLPARADSHDTNMSFEMVFKMADKNKDGMVTKAEFMDAMGKSYDMKMSKFKAAKDSTMVKGDAMTKDALKSLFNDIHSGA